jgi:Domain of unknown function DUF29
VRTIDMLPALYERDETAWLEIMAGMAQDGRAEELDLPHLAEYLSDMARRDRREVESRLVVLLAHLLKWDHQPGQRSRSWRATVIEQRQELNRLAARGVLRSHAEAVLAEIYPEAIERAAAETRTSPGLFPRKCPFTFDQLLAVELPAEDA